MSPRRPQYLGKARSLGVRVQVRRVLNNTVEQEVLPVSECSKSVEFPWLCTSFDPPIEVQSLHAHAQDGDANTTQHTIAYLTNEH